MSASHTKRVRRADGALEEEERDDEGKDDDDDDDDNEDDDGNEAGMSKSTVGVSVRSLVIENSFWWCYVNKTFVVFRCGVYSGSILAAYPTFCTGAGGASA